MPGEAKSLVSVAFDDTGTIDMAEVLAEVESRIIRWALKRSNGNLAQAATMLQIPRSSLQYKVKKLIGASAQNPS